MSTHTPGPWTVDAHRNIMATGGLVAFPGISAGFDQEANARLIAAAPDLLGALEEVLAYCVEHGHDWMCMADARATIVKATNPHQE